MNIDELNERAAEIAAKLKPKQRKFVEEYEKDGNATQAAIRAGYKEDAAAVTGCRLLRNANILAYRRIRASINFASLGISRDTLAADLVEIKERCMQAKPVMVWNYQTHKMEETGEYQFDSKGATKAIETLAEMIGEKDPTKINVTGHVAMPEITIDEREKILREIAEEFRSEKED